MIQPEEYQNFATLLAAVKAGRVAMMECEHVKTGSRALMLAILNPGPPAVDGGRPTVQAQLVGALFSPDEFNGVEQNFRHIKGEGTIAVIPREKPAAGAGPLKLILPGDARFHDN